VLMIEQITKDLRISETEFSRKLVKKDETLVKYKEKWGKLSK
jgi:hypothetical protein